MEPETKETTIRQNEILIFPDTSWLVAVIDEKDAHHISALSTLGAILPYKPEFQITVLAAMETLSRLIRNDGSVKDCRKKFLDLVGKKLHAKGATKRYNIREVLSIYDKWSRKEIKKLTTIDFSIVTEGISLKAKILTCDLKMYQVTKKYYEEIYFVSDKAKGQDSDLARLINDIQNRQT